jgi:hypothetical protein
MPGTRGGTETNRMRLTRSGNKKLKQNTNATTKQKQKKEHSQRLGDFKVLLLQGDQGGQVMKQFIDVV